MPRMDDECLCLRFVFGEVRQLVIHLIARRAYNDEPTIMAIDAVFLFREKRIRIPNGGIDLSRIAARGRRSSPSGNTGSWIRERPKQLRVISVIGLNEKEIPSRTEEGFIVMVNRQRRQSSSEASVTSNETSLSIEKSRSKLSHDCFRHCTTILMIDLWKRLKDYSREHEISKTKALILIRPRFSTWTNFSTCLYINRRRIDIAFHDGSRANLGSPVD